MLWLFLGAIARRGPNSSDWIRTMESSSAHEHKGHKTNTKNAHDGWRELADSLATKPDCEQKCEQSKHVHVPQRGMVGTAVTVAMVGGAGVVRRIVQVYHIS